MDPRTHAFYARYAEQLQPDSEARHSAMRATIAQALTPGQTVLDVGAGAGRDMAAMQELGLDAYGVEPHAGMRERALALHPGLAGRLADAGLPALGRPFADRCPAGFDAVVCSAVLMHLTPAELHRALAALVQQLRPGAGTLLLSLPQLDAERLRGDQDPEGRNFHNHAPAAVAQTLAAWQLRLSQESLSDVVWERTGTRWWTGVFRRDARPALTPTGA